MDTVHATPPPLRVAHQPAPANKAGYSVVAFAKAIDLSRECIYALWARSPDMAPRFVRLGRRRIITEHPTDYLRRVEAAQRVNGRSA
ncbi:MAG: hypothetical protein IT516_17255 [Burkholderiales bacterium]|nr:hypothetical protein [Burkholderiales bacterium]